MFRVSSTRWTATPSSFKVLGTTFTPPKRNGVGRQNKMRSKPSDNVAYYDRGPVEWIPRPVRLTYAQLDELRDFMMKETLHPTSAAKEGTTAPRAPAGSSEVFHRIRELHLEWGSGHPLLPVLGDSEPRFPHNLYKQNHRARHRFIVRWHKANSPNVWMWLPKGSLQAGATASSDTSTSDPSVKGEALHRRNRLEWPEYWQQRGGQSGGASTPRRLSSPSTEL